MAPSLIIAQGLGLIAMSMDIGSTLFTNDRRLVLAIALSSAIFAVHFYLLGGMAGAGSEAITVVRSLAALHMKCSLVGAGFLAGYVVLGIKAAIAGQWLEILPYIAGCAGTAAMFWCAGVQLRALFMLGQTCWLIYSIFNYSIGGSILYAILILSTLRTALRIRCAAISNV